MDNLSLVAVLTECEIPNTAIYEMLADTNGLGVFNTYPTISAVLAIQLRKVSPAHLSRGFSTWWLLGI
jgi:hypothetical protein